MRRMRFSKNRKCYVSIWGRTRQVSIRLPEQIYDIIDSYDGYNFTDKLINYIFDHEDEKLNQET